MLFWLEIIIFLYKTNVYMFVDRFGYFFQPVAFRLEQPAEAGGLNYRAGNTMAHLRRQWQVSRLLHRNRRGRMIYPNYRIIALLGG